MKLPLWRIAEFTGAKGEFDQESVAMGYSIDSRTVNFGDLFIALPGERFDGHDFVVSALEKGAVAALVQSGRAIPADSRRLLYVEDTLRALQSLGAAARRLWGKPLLAVTGSAGIGNDLARAVALRAGLLQGEEALRDAHLPLAVTGRAGPSLRAGLCACAVTGLARIHSGDADLRLAATRRFLQR